MARSATCAQPAADADQREPEEGPGQPGEIGDHDEPARARNSHRLAGATSVIVSAVLTRSTPTRRNTVAAITIARQLRSETDTRRPVVMKTRPTMAAATPRKIGRASCRGT